MNPMQSAVILRATNLTKTFPVAAQPFAKLRGLPPRAVRALTGVSLEVQRGETLGIVGESGCGKSTTARLLMRLMEPNAGSMIFDGEAVGENVATGGLTLREYRRQVQMVFQDS